MALLNLWNSIRARNQNELRDVKPVVLNDPRFPTEGGNWKITCHDMLPNTEILTGLNCHFSYLYFDIMKKKKLESIQPFVTFQTRRPACSWIFQSQQASCDVFCFHSSLLLIVSTVIFFFFLLVINPEFQFVLCVVSLRHNYPKLLFLLTAHVRRIYTYKYIHGCCEIQS